ncbi:hypothetical protein R3Q06_32380 [Rhodococcus erythropolis]|uniref:hypothetical protein n=1 Tax=Rhodococcus erythropolis TaxID=1833 RepID=UPI002949322B|nr:hypothetical protein [Rhodococcus erythropolis]MDV6278167.1 hypothetical protein [Rhodococcus erythropolis]
MDFEAFQVVGSTWSAMLFNIVIYPLYAGISMEASSRRRAEGEVVDTMLVLKASSNVRSGRFGDVGGCAALFGVKLFSGAECHHAEQSVKQREIVL